MELEAEVAKLKEQNQELEKKQVPIQNVNLRGLYALTFDLNGTS